MASPAQVEFFEQLLTDKEFGPTVNTEAVKAQFLTLNTKSASAWIEKAKELPDKEFVAPTF